MEFNGEFNGAIRQITQSEMTNQTDLKIEEKQDKTNKNLQSFLQSISINNHGSLKVKNICVLSPSNSPSIISSSIIQKLAEEGLFKIDDADKSDKLVARPEDLLPASLNLTKNLLQNNLTSSFIVVNQEYTILKVILFKTWDAIVDLLDTIKKPANEGLIELTEKIANISGGSATFDSKAFSDLINELLQSLKEQAKTDNADYSKERKTFIFIRLLLQQTLLYHHSLSSILLDPQTLALTPPSAEEIERLCNEEKLLINKKLQFFQTTISSFSTACLTIRNFLEETFQSVIQEEAQKILDNVKPKRKKGETFNVNKQKIKFQNEGKIKNVISQLNLLKNFHANRFPSILLFINSFNQLTKASQASNLLNSLFIDSFVEQIASYQDHCSKKIKFIAASLHEIGDSIPISNPLDKISLKLAMLNFQEIFKEVNRYQALMMLLTSVNLRLNKLKSTLSASSNESGEAEKDYIYTIDSWDELASIDSQKNSQSKKKPKTSKKASFLQKKPAENTKEEDDSQNEIAQRYAINSTTGPESVIASERLIFRQELAKQELAKQTDLLERLRAINLKTIDLKSVKDTLPLIVQLSSRYDYLLKQKQENSYEATQSLSDYSRSRFKISCQEIRDHVFMGQCGFEIFVKACLDQNIAIIADILPMLILDWSTQIEQYESSQYILNNNYPSNEHNLKTLTCQNHKWENLTPEHKEHVAAYDYGLFWPRYPATSKGKRSPAHTPKSLNDLLFVQELSQKVMKGEKKTIPKAEIARLLEVVSHVIKTHKNALNFLNVVLKPDASKTNLAFMTDSYELIDQFSGTLEKSIKTQLESLTGKTYASLKPASENMQKAFDTETRQFYASFSALNDAQTNLKKIDVEQGEALYSMMEDAKNHALRLSLLPIMAKTYQAPYLSAWHFRNALNVQWLIELLMRSHCLIQDVGLVYSHDFALIHGLLNQNQSETKQNRPSEGLKQLNIGKGFHYPRLAAKENKQTLALTLNRLTSQSKEFSEMPDEKSMDGSLEHVEMTYRLGAFHADRAANNFLAALKALNNQR